jgi:hypothetical protein
VLVAAADGVLREEVVDHLQVAMAVQPLIQIHFIILHTQEPFTER